MKTELTAELYDSWRHHPVTEALFVWMVSEIELAKSRWLNGDFTHEGNSDATFLVQAREQERSRVYRDIIQLTGEEFLQQVEGISE